MARVSDDLLLAAQSGDRHALTQLLVALQPDIRRYARRLCHRTSVIEDVVQEALIVVYRRVGTIRSPAALAGWLVTVIARLCMLPALMLMRGVEELTSLEESREFAKVPPDELRIDLVNAIESLSPSHREVLLLRDLEDLTIGKSRCGSASRAKRPKAACAAPVHWCANICSAQRTADQRAHELLSWSRHVRQHLPGRTSDPRRSCGGAPRLGHRSPGCAPLAIPGRGRCRPRRAARMPDVLDNGPGRDAFATPSRFNRRRGAVIETPGATLPILGLLNPGRDACRRSQQSGPVVW